MKKLLKIMLLCAAMCAVLCGCGKQNATVYFATDTHFLSERAEDDGEAFHRMLNYAQSKLVVYCRDIFSAFSDEVCENQPDLLILGGDLSFSGDEYSLEDVAEKLREIEDSGVEVIVIPGNHDIDSQTAYWFIGDEYVKAETVSADEFVSLFGDFGFSQAVSRDENSLSYLYKANDSLYILMADTNAYGEDYVQDGTFEWIETQLEYVNENGGDVIAVSHQNLYAVNENMSLGYQIFNADRLLSLYKKYGVKLNLSGHIHAQHITEGDVTEITTSSLIVTPVRYGIIEYDGGFTYATKSVDMKAYAERNGIDDEVFQSFGEYADSVFFENSSGWILSRMKDMNLSDEDAEKVADVFEAAALTEFTGRASDTESLADGIAILREKCGYTDEDIENLLARAEKDCTSYRIE